MPAASIPIQFGGEGLTLLADRAIHWPARQTLLLADVHLGKDASFRVAGLPVPAGNSIKDLARIESLLAATGATRLVILGDLVHARASHQSELATAFVTWRTRHRDLEILLVEGNHDRQAGSTPPDWRIKQVKEPYDDGALTFAHFNLEVDRPLLCGHLHPTVAVRDFDGSRVAMSCFVVGSRTITLPAFGSFTGGFKVRPNEEQKIYAVTGKSIVLVK